MELFNIAGKDLTRNITVPSYTINQNDVYKQWEDANHIVHRDITRTKIEGKFTMRFSDKDSYYDFLQLVENNKNKGGYITATLYVNNKNMTVTANVFLVFTPANTVPLFRNGTYSGFEVKVMEA